MGSQWIRNCSPTHTVCSTYILSWPEIYYLYARSRYSGYSLLRLNYILAIVSWFNQTATMHSLYSMFHVALLGLACRYARQYAYWPGLSFYNVAPPAWSFYRLLNDPSLTGFIRHLVWSWDCTFPALWSFTTFIRVARDACLTVIQHRNSLTNLVRPYCFSFISHQTEQPAEFRRLWSPLTGHLCHDGPVITPHPGWSDRFPVYSV